MNAEKQRLEDDRLGKATWRKWGPYVSDRQWGTVREDYSAGGDAWDYLPFDHARSRAYRWGEDGIAGVCDDKQQLCLSLALWNGRDPILKERYFGLSNSQGNHGEDVKELYYYLDATPTHSYLKMLYKYPQAEFPYQKLLDENAKRDRHDPEYELIDTGLFDEDCYFDVFVEYCKDSFEDLYMKVTVYNRGPEEASLYLLPQLWYRNIWSWTADKLVPSLSMVGQNVIHAQHPVLGDYWLHAEGTPAFLFCDNNTNAHRLFGEEVSDGYFKDAFHDYVINGVTSAVNPQRTGTKAAALYEMKVPARGSASVRLCLSNKLQSDPFGQSEVLLNKRRLEADEFYAELQQEMTNADEINIQRQALAGMIWSKQFYYYDVRQWLMGDPAEPAPPAERIQGRNRNWLHLDNAAIISMPDKWEYPWYAAWDLSFHCIAMSLVDPEFAKEQLVKLTHSWYMHPTGQLPAYEWNFDDANPPVHAMATWRVYQIDRKEKGGTGDLEFLERVFHKLLLNFTWWVNRKDAHDRNIFQGGFLGLDNIGVFDRDQPLPNGGTLDQADGTSWMAMYCLNLMRIALELAMKDPVYQDIATKFFEHFLQIAQSINGIHTFGGQSLGLWDDVDEFYYDAVNCPGNHRILLKVRSLVGLLPLLAVETLESENLKHAPDFRWRLKWYLQHREDMCQLVSRWQTPGEGMRGLLSLLRGHRMKCLLRRMLDETEFLSEYGVRALSRYHLEHPYTFEAEGHSSTIDYEPGESTTNMFGGNSNWRGPIWFPMNYLFIEALQKFHYYYGDDFKIECPTNSGNMITILEVANELTRRLSKIFLRDSQGRRAVFGKNKKFQTDPHFRDYIPYFEYFHGDNGMGLGASHQTGWTGLIAKLLMPREKPETSPVSSTREAAR